MSRATTTTTSSCSLPTRRETRSAPLTIMPSTLSRARKMMQEWADFLEHTQRGGKVLPFRSSAA